MAETVILVLGATGRIGRMVRNRLIELPEANAAFRLQTRRNLASLPVPKGCSWVKWDADDPAASDDAFAGVDVVLHLAGITPTAGVAVEDAEFERINVETTLQVLEKSAAAGVNRVLIASSAAVYGRPTGDAPFDENTKLAPLNAYGKSKASMEAAVSDWAQLHPEVETCCLRISTIAGADQLVQNALTATDDAPLTLDQFASGKGPLRSYIGPDDLATVLIALCRSTRTLPSALNISGPHAVRMDDLLIALSGVRGTPIPWTYRPAPEAAIETVVLDLTRLESLGLMPLSGDGTTNLAEQALTLHKNQSHQ